MQQIEQLTHEANEHFEAGRYRKAEKLYRKMLDQEPGNYQVLLMMGVCRQKRRDAGGALEYFQHAVAAADNRPITHYQLGRQLLEMRRIDEARESLAQAVALNPNHAPARTLMGYSFVMTGDHKRAADELRTARRADENYAPAATMLALALLESGELDEAAKMANHAVHLTPEDAGAQSILGRVLLAQGHAHFAEQCFRNALQRHPDNLELRAGLGKALRRTGHVAEAVDTLESVLRDGMQVPEIAIEYARALADQGRAGASLAVLEQLPEAAADESVQVLTAQLKVATGDAPGARVILDRLPQANPEKALLEARLRAAEDDLDGAVTELEPLFDHPDQEIVRRARLMAADICLSADAADRAHGFLEPLLAAVPPDKTALDIWVGHLRGARRWDELVALVEPVLERADLDALEKARVSGLLATALDAAGQTARAAEYLEAGAWREPNFLELYQNDASRQARAALIAAPEAHWQALTDGIEPADQAPVFMIGWPGSGQAELAAVLAAHDDVSVLPAAGRQARVRYAAALSGVDGQAVSAQQCAEARRMFLSSAGETARGVLLDTNAYEVALLPGIARLFPGATVIVVSAQEADLHLHWMMSGLRRPLDILDAYRRERELFQHLQDKLPLEFVVLPRHRLLGAPQETLESLYRQLGLGWDESDAAELRRRAEERPLLADGHWKHYAAVLGRD